MATTINDLSPADQADFKARLAIYGLTTAAITQPDLVVPAGKTVTLSASDPSSAAKPQLLTSRNLDQVKSWIGIPDSVFTKKILASHLPIPAALPSATAEAKVTAAVAARPLLTSVELDSIRIAATAYIYGNSALASSFKSAIEQVFPIVQIPVFVFYTITVNGVLTLGPGQNVLTAWKIIIEPGGQIVCKNGNLRLNCTILQKV